uniref:P53 domain-containing protein n=1 Tax=Syphacia muris TaxID=451379 RepID=A0A0N5B0J2_9BILA
MSKDIPENSKACLKKADTLECFFDDDSLSVSTEVVEKLLCTEIEMPIPNVTLSDVAKNIDSGPTDLDGKSYSHLINENDKFFVDIPSNYAGSTSDFADIFVNQLERTKSCVEQPCLKEPSSVCGMGGEGVTTSLYDLPSEATTSGVFNGKVPLNFNVVVDGISKRKTNDYVYNEAEECLFAKPFINVPFQISCTTALPSDAFIRVCAFYTQAVYASQPVERCPHHLAADDTKVREHFIVSDSEFATYIDARWAGERPHLILPYPSADSPFIILQFRCYSSCNGGINRRSVTLSFSLEANGKVLETKKIGLKVCACPNRDAVNDGFEPPLKKKRTVTLKKKTEVVTKSSESFGNSFLEDDETVYEIQIRGRHLYKLVCSIVHNYELSRRYLREKDSKHLEVSPLRSYSRSLSPRTSITSWLNDLGLLKYVSNFHSNSLYVLDDLENVINKKFLLSIGVNSSDVSKLLTSYLSWFNVYNAQRMSTLSSIDASIRIQRTRLCSKI